MPCATVTGTSQLAMSASTSVFALAITVAKSSGWLNVPG
jgi:hypothetical protein